MNKIVKDAVILTLITLVAGLSLGFVYEITKGPIEKSQEKAKQEAYKAVFESAGAFEDVKVDDADAASVLAEAGLEESVIDGYAKANDADGNLLGYVVSVTNNEGYGGSIELSVGIALDGTIKGVEILSISETAGLGMKANTTEFKDQYKDVNVEAFEYTKNGATESGQIDVISGATITTNAMTNGVNAGLAYFRTLEGGNVNE